MKAFRVLRVSRQLRAFKTAAFHMTLAPIYFQTRGLSGSFRLQQTCLPILSKIVDQSACGAAKNLKTLKTALLVLLLKLLYHIASLSFPIYFKWSFKCFQLSVQVKFCCIDGVGLKFSWSAQCSTFEIYGIFSFSSRYRLNSWHHI